MKIKTKVNKKIITKDENGQVNGYLIPFYNVNEGFHEEHKEPKQAYLTVVKKGSIKGPHLHYIRTGFFTCIKGNVKIIVKKGKEFSVHYSGEDYNYLSILIPAGVPAAVQNIGDDDAFIINMPSPAWTPEMDDEHTADFSDFDFDK